MQWLVCQYSSLYTSNTDVGELVKCLYIFIIVSMYPESTGKKTSPDLPGWKEIRGTFSGIEYGCPG